MAFTKEDVGLHVDNNILKYWAGIILGGGTAGAVAGHYLDEKYLEPQSDFFESQLGDVVSHGPLAIAGMVAAFFALVGVVTALHRIAPRQKR